MFSHSGTEGATNPLGTGCLDVSGALQVRPPGRYDTMSVADVERMGSLIPRSKVVICARGSHLSLCDDQAAYFDALIPFVRDAHAARW